MERLRASLADRYRIERELGQGGMATVYLAQDLRHDRRVALKVLKPELAAVLGAERFVVEIKTTAALQHPHILPLFDSGTADGFLFYVMPFIDGETLRSKLDRETQLGIEEAIRITTQVADALDYAHRHGVIHRDIKPENILLHDGRPMVVDFGIALALSAAAGGRMTETGLSLGTPHYMSPEQATAEKELTNRSDIYSLGSVLYEMLTGNPPHVGASAQQIIMKIVTETPAPVTQMRKSVPPNVAMAVGKALEKLPADRFNSAKAFAEALANPAFAAATATGTP
ncbi:MAG TPA: serine/threonine-protein kinase, partial [Gemmatimonadales bacterium]|nr:serine/threonine-protein kinase [Gemmatimonadales bacterium]